MTAFLWAEVEVHWAGTGTNLASMGQAVDGWSHEWSQMRHSAGAEDRVPGEGQLAVEVKHSGLVHVADAGRVQERRLQIGLPHRAFDVGDERGRGQLPRP